ncbi:MAG: acyltransferase [Marinobacterium sp.]
MLVFFDFINSIIKYSSRKIRLKKALDGGMILGSRTRFVGDVFFGTEPFLIKIGDDCLFTDGVKFMTHDGAVQVPIIKRSGSSSDVYGRFFIGGPIRIGDNVFVGNNSIILYGSVIGDNCIIGSGSVVKGIFPENSVIAGVPARVISNVDDYYSSNREKIFEVNSKSSSGRRKEISRKIEL